MAKRHVYTAAPRHPAGTSRSPNENLRYLASMASQYIWTGFNMVNGNYLALATVIAVVLLSFLIPDISQKIHATSELKNIKNVVNLMTKEVDRAEVACLTAADEVCYLQCSMIDDATETSTNRKDVCTRHCSIRSTKSEPVQVEQIGLFERMFFSNRNTSHKEIAIMSYLYTNSFDAMKNKSTSLMDTIHVPSRCSGALND